jgi:hypothetical protein
MCVCLYYPHFSNVISKFIGFVAFTHQFVRLPDRIELFDLNRQLSHLEGFGNIATGKSLIPLL